MDFSNFVTYLYIGIPLLMILVWFLRPKKRNIIVNETLIENIFKAVDKENIVKVESEVSRVKIEVLDLEKVNYDLLKEISEGVFISGRSLKIMFKDSADDIVEAMKRGL